MNTSNGQQAEPEFAAYVGLDWSDKKHAWSLEPAGSGKTERGEFGSDPQKVEEWVETLNRRFAGKPIAVGLEHTRGPLLWMLSVHSNLWLYLIHPKAATNLRSALYPSGTKNDPVDADVIRMAVEKFRQHWQVWKPDTADIEQLRSLVRRRRKLVDEKTQQTNRLSGELKVCFPQVLEWFDSLGTDVVADFLRRWPTLSHVQKARRQTLLDFFHKHNSHSAKRNAERLDAIGVSKAVTEDAAVLEPAQIEVRARLNIISALRDAIQELDEDIESRYKSHPDAVIFASFPAAGPVMGPRLMAAFGSCRERFQSAAQVQSLSGIAPVGRSSGSSGTVRKRKACPKFLRQTFHEYATHTIGRCAWATEFYELQKQRGNRHHAAVRSLAYKWIRILYHCWANRVPYDDSIHAARRTQAAIASDNHGRAASVGILWETCGGMNKATKISY